MIYHNTIDYEAGQEVFAATNGNLILHKISKNNA